MPQPHLTALAALAMLAAGVALSAQDAAGCDAPLPRKLSETGLYEPGAGLRVATGIQLVSPVYPLWSDGTRKRRWILLPPGTAIDGSDADAWEFPVGTRLWKEFAYDRPVETRYIERCAGGWRFAAYRWQDDGLDAELAPVEGVRSFPVSSSPNGRYSIPAELDCRSCHEGTKVPVLGISAVQLSPVADPAAPHAERDREGADIEALVARGWLRGLPDVARRSRIDAGSDAERAALGYLHGNCGHCHNESGPLATLALDLSQLATDPVASRARTLASLTATPSRFANDAGQVAARVSPGDAQASVIVARLRSRNPYTQMPPLGTQLPDEAGVALIERWINQELNISTEETQ